MRELHFSAISSFFLAFLLASCAIVCPAASVHPTHQCMFDELQAEEGAADMPVVEVVRELPGNKKDALQAYTVAGLKGDDAHWKPIRIEVSLEDLKNPERYCTTTTNGHKRPNFKGKTLLCEESDIFNSQKFSTLVEVLLPVAVKLHADRLLVQRSPSPWKVPANTSTTGPCEHFTIPNKHISTGISDADMVLYVAAGTGRSTWATACDVAGTTRPLAGAMHVFPQDIPGRLTARALAHEIAHALGFDHARMANLKMTREVTQKDGKTIVTVVDSKMTKAMTRLHYNCPTAPGLALQAWKVGQVESHWSSHLAKDELMSPFVYYTGGYYTVLTLAAFHDMGFYRANWDMAEPMSWGNLSGCALLEEECSEQSAKTYPKLFCDGTNKKIRCSSDRYFLGQCDEMTVVVGNHSNEQCPLVLPTAKLHGESDDLYGVCANGQTHHFPGSRAGPGSWCLDVDPFTAQQPDKTFSSDVIAGVCAEISCANGRVKVRYQGGGEKWHECTEGGFITPTPEAPFSGRIMCPEYNEVCTVAANGSSLITPDRFFMAGGRVQETKMGKHGGDAAAGVACVGPLVLFAMLLSSIALVPS